jgi:hypothetical protein
MANTTGGYSHIDARMAPASYHVFDQATGMVGAGLFGLPSWIPIGNESILKNDVDGGAGRRPARARWPASEADRCDTAERCAHQHLANANGHRPHDHRSRRGSKRRWRFFWPRLFLRFKRRSSAQRGGRVDLRGLGGTAALRINWTSRSIACWRFASCVRSLLASMTNSPSELILLWARCRSRALTSAGRFPLWLTLNRNCTAEAVRFTFCPPGPLPRMK